MLEGALEILAAARAERMKRLEDLIRTMGSSRETAVSGGESLWERWQRARDIILPYDSETVGAGDREGFLEGLERVVSSGRRDYIDAIRALPETDCRRGTAWLQELTANLCERTLESLH